MNRRFAKTSLMAASIAAGALVVGCSDVSLEPDNGMVDNTTFTTLGAQGGEAKSEDGLLVLKFPAGSLEAETEITIARSVGGRSGLKGELYELGPHGLQFESPVTFELLVDGTTPLVIGNTDHEVTRALAGSVHAGGKVSAPLSHFSEYGAFAEQCSANTDCPEELSCINGLCGAPCEVAEDCGANTACIEGVCEGWEEICENGLDDDLDGFVDEDCGDEIPCVSRTDCPYGQDCFSGICADLESCECDDSDPCTTDSCDNGGCTYEYDINTCGGCASNADCASGMYCSENACVADGTTEICDDGIDNDDDGFIDTADDDCGDECVSRTDCDANGGYDCINGYCQLFIQCTGDSDCPTDLSCFDGFCAE